MYGAEAFVGVLPQLPIADDVVVATRIACGPPNRTSRGFNTCAIGKAPVNRAALQATSAGAVSRLLISATVPPVAYLPGGRSIFIATRMSGSGI
jgi:hypothetical protein